MPLHNPVVVVTVVVVVVVVIVNVLVIVVVVTVVTVLVVHKLHMIGHSSATTNPLNLPPHLKSAVIGLAGSHFPVSGFATYPSGALVAHADGSLLGLWTEQNFVWQTNSSLLSCQLQIGRFCTSAFQHPPNCAVSASLHKGASATPLHRGVVVVVVVAVVVVEVTVVVVVVVAVTVVAVTVVVVEMHPPSL